MEDYPANRIKKNTDCPYCSNYYASDENNLEVNFPKIAREWHPTMNNDITPSSIMPGTAKKFWWVCEKGHEWEASPNSRTSSNTGCPRCSNQSSEPEIRVLTELMYIFDSVKTRYKIQSLEMDVYIPAFNIGIEYDGHYYHKDRAVQDKNKNRVLEKEGVNLIRVRQHPLQPLSSLDIIHSGKILTKAVLNETLLMIRPLVDKTHSRKITKYLSINRFINQDLFNKYISYFPNPFPENSIEFLFPKLCEEWNFEKNNPLLPFNFSKGSDKKVWWKCDKGHEWEAAISLRTSQNTQCPFCAGQRAGFDNNLAVISPELAQQWHPTKNKTLTPKDVRPGSKIKVWWQCEKGHEWEAVIYSRKNNGCPYCSGQRTSQENSLQTLFPKIAKEWHPIKNGLKTPDEFTKSSGQKVWWKCDKGHEWQAFISSRTNKRNSGICPYCSGRRRI